MGNPSWEVANGNSTPSVLRPTFPAGKLYTLWPARATTSTQNRAGWIDRCVQIYSRGDLIWNLQRWNVSRIGKFYNSISYSYGTSGVHRNNQGYNGGWIQAQDKEVERDNIYFPIRAPPWNIQSTAATAAYHGGRYVQNAECGHTNRSST